MKIKVLKVLKRVGLSFLVIIFFFFCLVFFPLSDIKFPEKNYKNLLIENVHIIDVENDTILKNHHILITDDKITEISKSTIKNKVSNVKVIQGNENYIIPAFFDMHAHLTKNAILSAYPEYIMNGVMYLREMRGSYNTTAPFVSTPKRIKAWNEKVKNYWVLRYLIFQVLLSMDQVVNIKVSPIFLIVAQKKMLRS